MKDPNAVALGRKGGRAQVKKVGVEQMRNWGRKGGKSRWAGMTAEERKAATEPARAARRKKSEQAK